MFPRVKQLQVFLTFMQTAQKKDKISPCAPCSFNIVKVVAQLMLCARHAEWQGFI